MHCRLGLETLRSTLRVTLVGLALAGCAPRGASPAGTPTIPTNSPVPKGPTKTIWGVGAGSLVQFVPDLIVDQGFLAQHSVEMDRRAMTAVTAADALGANEIDFTTYTSSAARAAAKGLPVRVVAVLTTGSWSLVAGHGINSVQDLKGKTVGITAVGTDESAYLKAVLEKGGLSVNDVTQLSLAQEAPLVAALEGNKVAAVILVPPWTQQEKGKGYKLLATPASARFAGGGLATSVKLLQSRPDVVQGVLQALVDTVIWTRSHRDEAIAFFARKYQLDPGVAADGYQEQMDALAFNFTDEELQGTLTRAVGALQEQNTPVAVSQVYDLTIYRSLVTKAGLTN